jgi:hypothetical protein
MADADVLLLEGWDAALGLLQQDGFSVWERADHAWALQSPSGDILELHRGLSSCPGLFPIDADGLWRRRVAAPPFERPGGEDLLVQLAIHAAFQHGLRLRLGQYLDFRLLLERPLDLGLVLEIAARHGAEACLFASLAAAELLVGAPFPLPLRAALQTCASRRMLRRVASLGLDPLALLAPASPRDVARWRLLLAGRRRIALIAHTLGRHEGTLVSQAVRGVRLLRQLV